MVCFFPVLLGCSTRGPGGPASLGHGPHSSIFSPTDLNSNCSIRGTEGPLCWVLVLSTASYLQLTRTSCALSYIIVLHPLNSTCRQSRLSLWYLQPDAPVIYTGAFPILTAWPGERSICNIMTWEVPYFFLCRMIIKKIDIYSMKFSNDSAGWYWIISW